jgi:arylsulfatase A-like enzyme
MDLSELLPSTAGIADELTLIRSMTTDSIDHESALRCFHTGRVHAGFPSWGSWVTYALGTDCQNLPAYVVLTHAKGLPTDGVRNWTAGWLPALHQGTPISVARRSPVVHLSQPAGMPPQARTEQLAFLAQLNRRHERKHPGNSELAARIENFELAARMQLSVPEVLDASRETEATQRMYGLDRPECREYGTRCMLARRLVEAGVRFVQLFQHEQPWDTHAKNAESLRNICQATDQPAAALVADLKQRGLLDSTVVIWGGEFGRLPIAQDKDGRDHNRHGFSLWIAGGGFRPGYIHGETDAFGYRAVRDVVSVHDLHATLLHALGQDHRTLTYPYEGRPTTLTAPEVTKAQVVDELLA